jgi:dephospho-CoA kinase
MKTFQHYINPEIKAIIQEQLDHLDGIVLLERAMLLFDGMEDFVDGIVFVSCSPEAQKERLLHADL